MNYVSLKKFLVLSSAILAFGNIANALQDENDPSKAYVYNMDVSHELIDFNGYNNAIQNIKIGISQNISNILSSSNKDFKDNFIKQLQINQVSVNSLDPNIITGELINSRRQNTLNKSDDNFSEDKNSAMELLAIIQTMKDIQKVVQQNFKQIQNNYVYNLFYNIANNITDNDMKTLTKTISDNYNTYNTRMDFSFLVATLNEIIKTSKYMLQDKDNDNLNNIINNSKNIMFKHSMNGKVFSRYTFDSRDGNLEKADNASANIDENNYSEEKANLHEIISKINTAWAMNKSEYNTLLMNPILKEKDIVSKIKEETLDLPSSVESVDALLQLLTDIKNGKIQNKKNNPEDPIDQDNSNNSNYTKFQEEVKELNKKINELEKNKNLKKEDKEKLEQYKAEIIVLNDIKQAEFKQKEDTKKLDEYKKIIEAIEKTLKQNPDDGNPQLPPVDNKYDIPGITDKLAEKNLYIKDIKIANKAESNKIIKIFDVNGLVNAGAGVITVDTNVKRNNLRRPDDKLTYARSICSIFNDAGVFNPKAGDIRAILANDFLNIEIAKINS